MKCRCLATLPHKCNQRARQSGLCDWCDDDSSIDHAELDYLGNEPEFQWAHDLWAHVRYRALETYQ